MLGLRGVPATFGGVERHVEEIGRRLVTDGHDVTVFCRTNYSSGREPEYAGMHLQYLPSIGTKHLDAFSHTTLATLRALRGFDVLHYHALGPGLLAPIPRALARHSAVVLTVHGLDNRREKWGPMARRVLSVGEWMSGRVPHATIAVSATLGDHYRDAHGREVAVIPNGITSITPRNPAEIVSRFGLQRHGYILFVGRLVPEKNPHLLIRAFAELDTDLKLVVVGGSSFTDDYVDELQRLAAGNPRVVFTGYAHGSLLDELYSNAAVFVSPSSLEAGPPLTLLEAASCATPVVVSDIPQHREVVERDAPGRRLFRDRDIDSLRLALARALAESDEERVGAGYLRAETRSVYDWDGAALLTAGVYRQALGVVRGRSGEPAL